MEFTKAPGFGERFYFPENVEITINGDTLSTIREAAVRMAERWEEAVVGEIVKEAQLAGYTEVTVLDKEAIMLAMAKQIPMKVGREHNCPRCMNRVHRPVGVGNEHYCVHCGQLVTWRRSDDSGK